MKNLSRPVSIVICLSAFLIILQPSTNQTQILPNDSTKTRLQPIVKGILAAFDKYDVVCLGEDHASKNDSDLRIAVVEHPDFVRKVNVVMVEFANTVRQDVLDRLALDGEDVPREQLREAWAGMSSSSLWDLPTYEAVLRAIRNVNLSLPRERRIRILAGDNFAQTNRGKVILELVGREILDKHLKGLAVYGAGHCERRGMGFPGELEDKYPKRIWSAFNFYDVEAGRQMFSLTDEPALIPVTDKAKLPIGKMFSLGRSNDQATLADITNAIVYYGNIKDVKVSAQR